MSVRKAFIRNPFTQEPANNNDNLTLFITPVPRVYAI